MIILKSAPRVPMLGIPWIDWRVPKKTGFLG
ncbi:unnamed protein product, partial [Vitis vinifera]|uniref:Uncharacterized protein n=1 Tax=Vitis vinifera TaxID=29760 RepID=D7TRT0_VITVI